MISAYHVAICNTLNNFYQMSKLQGLTSLFCRSKRWTTTFLTKQVLLLVPAPHGTLVPALIGLLVSIFIDKPKQNDIHL
jgi:hypothetical protein